MKRFAIIEVAAGIFIADTQTTRHPAKAITAYADTYEDARTIRDKKRRQREHRLSIADEKWHRSYQHAVEHGHFEELNRLCGIK